MLMASAGLELAYVILLGFSATEYFYYPWGLWSANLISTLLLISISLVQVLAFTLPIAKPRTSPDMTFNYRSINSFFRQQQECLRYYQKYWPNTFSAFA
jgi:hypothetical protein